MSDTPFSLDYDQARHRFRTAAKDAGAHLAAYQHPEPGAQGQGLTTDVAWLGPADAEQVLVTVSGTHGVEGFAGSACQLDWLQREEYRRLPPGVAACLVHAINPYGFSWLRRVTHENVDLNRNWIDFDQPAPANDGYDILAQALCPESLSGRPGAQADLRLQAFIAERGMAAMAQAVSGGQYRHPDGLFYGGLAPTWSRHTLTRIFNDHLARARSIGVIDFHTGLGPVGYGELMISEPANSPSAERARRRHGGLVIPIGAQASASAALAGDWLAMAPRLAPQAEVTAVAIEFGTVAPLDVLAALRADNWLHAKGDPKGPEAAAIKAQIRDAFYVPTDLWRGMMLGQALVAQRQAASGLGAT